MHRVHMILAVGLAWLLSTTPVMAATPDGASGPFADQIISFSQGTQKDGSAVDAARSDSSESLGPDDSGFVSLGFDGVIVLHFDQQQAPTRGVNLEEVTNGAYPTESVQVEFSTDGNNWVYGGTENTSGFVRMPDSLDCATYVKITEISDRDDHPDDSDGYDLDSVEADDPGYCDESSPQPSPTPTVTSPTVEPTNAPTSAPSNDQNDQPTGKRTVLGKNGPTCETRRFTATFDVYDGTTPKENVKVAFTYRGSNRVETETNSHGRASVSYDYQGEGTLVADADDYPDQSLHINVLDCEDGAVLGISSDSAVGGQVLGASTDTLAATGSLGYLTLAGLSSMMTGLVYIGVKRLLS